MNLQTLRDILILIVITLVMAVAASAFGDSIRLHDQVGVEQPRVLLRDVAELQGQTAGRLGDMVVAHFAPGQSRLTVRLAEVRRKLSDDGRVNWATLTLKGYVACRVERLEDEPTLIGPGDEPSPVIANPYDEVDLNSPVTIRDRLIEQIAQRAGTPRTDLRITFAARDEALLRSSAWADRLVYEPQSVSPLGRVPIVVRRYRGDELVETHRVVADVARRTTAVVTTRGVGRGQTFAPGDLALRQVYLSRDDGEPLAAVSDAVGQVAAALLRRSTVLYPKHVSLPRLVRRGQIITVRCIRGGVEVTTIARAEADGAAGELIKVRNERSRQSYPVRVTAMRQAVAITSDAATEPQPQRAAP
ncbi:MAG: flagellar basal body P-ring formation chaperone FlgA [Phycisphaeraceae bacterium]